MPLRLRLSAAPVMLVSLVFLASCGGAAPSTRDGPAPQQMTTAQALGEPRTTDPCTLADPAALNRFGKVTEADTVSLDYCLLHVEMGDGSRAQLSVGGLEPGGANPGDPVEQRGGVRVSEQAPLAGHCGRRVLFADGVAMQISADLLTGKPGAGLCGLAGAGADGAVTAMQRHNVGHRQVPPASLAWVDPCTVLDTAVVRQVPGMEDAQPQPSPGGHQCKWGEQDAQSPRVQLVHTAGSPPKVLHGAATEDEVAGRHTVVSVVGGDPRTPLCSAETSHLPFGDPKSGQVEVAMLVVALPGSDGIETCEFARGLAERAWPKLPKT